MKYVYWLAMVYLLKKRPKQKAEYKKAHQIIERNDLSSHSLYMCVWLCEFMWGILLNPTPEISALKSRPWK